MVSGLERGSSTENCLDKASGLMFLETGAVGYGEIEVVKEQSPPGLTGVETLGCLNVSKVLMIRPYQERKFHPLEPVPPLLQCQLDCQQLLVSHVIIPLRTRESPGEKGTGMQLLAGFTMLGQDCPHPNI